MVDPSAIASGTKGQRLLLLGNEAVVRGGLEAGFSVFTSYPRTPASEILDVAAQVSQAAGRNPSLETELGAQRADLPKLLSESDFGSISVSLNDKTRGMIGAKEFDLMKRTAILVNTSRGAVIDESALVSALKERKIVGVGLDVFEREPLPKESPLMALDNIVLLPHVASATVETRERMTILAAQNIVDVLSGKLPRAFLNKEVQSVRPLADVRMI